MHSMWKGAISFGLVMIPVKLYAATEQKDIAFRQVHRADGGRIRFRRVCSVCGEEVPYEEVAKGYELPTGEMVVLTEEDMAELPLPSTRSIEVMHFMPAGQLDPILLSRSYYVEPEVSGARAYVLLRDSLDRSGKVALAQIALRQRESLATLRTRDGVLVLETLLWPDEVRTPAFGFLDDDIEVRSQELRMASSLIDSMTVDFDPAAYRDGYREALQELVAAKTEGREVVQPDAPTSTEGEPTSLADALKASLTAAREGHGQTSRGRAARSGSTGTAGTGTAGTTGSGSAGSGPSRTGAAARTGARATGGAKTSAARTSAANPSATETSATTGTGAKGTAATGITTKAGAARRTAAKDGPAKDGVAKAGAAKAGAAKAGAAKAGAAKADSTNDGAANDGAAKAARPASRTTERTTPPQARTRRRAS